MKRLFVGISLTGEARERTEAVLERLREEAAHQAARWVRPEKLHLTLVFLGAVEEERVATVAAACASVSAGRFELSTTELGGFPDLRRPKVVWLGVAESEPLRRLQAELAARLSELVRIEERAFHPHITLGRVSPGSPAVGHMVRAVAEAEGSLFSEWVPSGFSLMESTPDGRYEEVAGFSFT